MLLPVILQDTAGRVPEVYGEGGNEGERKLRKRGGIGRKVRGGKVRKGGEGGEGGSEGGSEGGRE